MSEQILFTCGSCGEKFHEVSYENEKHPELTIEYVWDEVSTGQHSLREKSNLCPKCA